MINWQKATFLIDVTENSRMLIFTMIGLKVTKSNLAWTHTDRNTEPHRHLPADECTSVARTKMSLNGNGHKSACRVRYGIFSGYFLFWFAERMKKIWIFFVCETMVKPCVFQTRNEHFINLYHETSMQKRES